MIILSCDHGAFELAQKLTKFFHKHNIEYKYMGPKEFNKDDDYPDFIIPASKEVLLDKSNRGIFLCGSGIGANMVAIDLKEFVLYVQMTMCLLISPEKTKMRMSLQWEQELFRIEPQ